MDSANNAGQPTQADQSLETLRDIRRMMERSSRFISLSGLSGLSAGLCALVGAWIAGGLLKSYYASGGVISREGYRPGEAYSLEWQIVLLGGAVLLAALASSMYFTWRKARKHNLPFWDHTARKLLINIAIPLGAGGLFVLGLFYHSEWHMIAPTCLVFYGLALVNASKYTLTDIRYLGILEILLGSVNMYFPAYGIYFWAVGFGLLHIIYGLIMWWKYERNTGAGV